jgi:hypothetical protein
MTGAFELPAVTPQLARAAAPIQVYSTLKHFKSLYVLPNALARDMDALPRQMKLFAVSDSVDIGL